MATGIARPDRADDYSGWEKYHLARADEIGKQPAAADLSTRIGQLQGEVDHRAEAIGYAELAAKQASRPFAVPESRGIDAGKQGASDQKKETVVADENVSRELKPVAQLSDKEIVTEAREIHAHFKQLSERFEQATSGRRPEIREEMVPLVNRERELRQESAGRLKPEWSQDRVPEQQMGYSR
jgi:hypothetical protein